MATTIFNMPIRYLALFYHTGCTKKHWPTLTHSTCYNTTQSKQGIVIYSNKYTSCTS